MGQRESLFAAWVKLSQVFGQTVTLHNANAPSSKESLKNTYPHTAPVLDVAFSGKADQGAKCYSGGLDRQVREIDLASGQQTILGSHNEAVRCVNWSDETSLSFSVCCKVLSNDLCRSLSHCFMGRQPKNMGSSFNTFKQYPSHSFTRQSFLHGYFGQ